MIFTPACDSISIPTPLIFSLPVCDEMMMSDCFAFWAISHAPPEPDAPPQPTREQNLRKSAELWKRALAAEEAGDIPRVAVLEERMAAVWRGFLTSDWPM